MANKEYRGFLVVAPITDRRYDKHYNVDEGTKQFGIGKGPHFLDGFVRFEDVLTKDFLGAKVHVTKTDSEIKILIKK